MKSHWKQVGKRLLGILGWWVLGIITLFVILNFYTLPWTGFGDYKTPTGEFIRGKTLWDWMELLVIPFFLWAGAVAVNRSERELERQRVEDRSKLEREITLDRQQEEVLQGYLDRMAELLLRDKLRITRNKEARNVARTRTLTVLRRLDPSRKGIVLRFLHEAGLITTEKNIVDLQSADFQGVDLQNVDLRYVDLQGANLRFANLKNIGFLGANLKHADMQNASLESSTLLYVNLQGANLQNANLRGSDIEHADLQHTNFQDANLQYADLRYSNLKNAFLNGANLDNAHLENTNIDDADFDGRLVSL
jgi:uncharacterized protein YjbI with pentapeptide repeats